MILDTFESYRNKKKYLKSSEYRFFRNNQAYLYSYPWLKKYLIIKDDFSLICSNIVIQALINKKVLETTYSYATLLAQQKEKESSEYHAIIKEELNHAKLNLPYLEKNNMKIYIPIFDLATNTIYDEEIFRLDNYPYSLLKEDFKDVIVNPFETYNKFLFNSTFTRLVHLGGDKTSDAYYHLVFETIYFINHQGGLDYVIPLFDDNIKCPRKEDSLTRIKPVVDAYYRLDRDGLIDTLYRNDLISENVYRKLKKKVKLNEKRKGTR